MNSKASVTNIHNLSFDSNVTVFDRETQTSNTSIKLMSSDHQINKSTSESTNSACNDDNIKVFEFCELVKDPQDDTVSIVKETFTEEVLTNPDDFGKPTHNKYRYCREVIQPFCKTYSTACPKYPTHREIPFKKSLSNTSKGSKARVSSSGSIAMSSDSKKSTFENPSNSSIKKKRPCPPTLPLNIKKECQKEATECEPYSKCPKYKDEAKLKEYLSSCVSTTVTMAKKASASCLEKCEKTIGIRPPKCGEDKPTYYVLKKPKSKENVIDKSNYEGILDSEIVQNFTSGMKSLVGTVISKTKETVNTITRGSCKDLTPDIERKPKDVENKILSKVASILPNKLNNQEETSGNNSLTEIKTSITNIFNGQDSEANETLSFSKITSVIPNPFKSKEAKAETSENSLTRIKSSITNTFKSQDSEINKKSSISQLVTMIPNPFKSEENNANSSLTKLTSIFKNPFKDKADSNCENKSLTRINTVLSKTITNNQDHSTTVKDNITINKIVEPAVAAIERVATAVTKTASATISTAKNVKESFSMTNIINGRIDKSSPEDDPNIVRRKPPENVSLERERIPEPDDNSQSMFTMLKTKLFSMFADNTEDGDEEGDEEDENVAEKLFNKFCDQ